MMKNHWNDLRNDYLSDLLSMVKIGIWDWDLQTGRVIYSSAWAEIFGYTKEELPQRVETWESMVFPEDLTQVNKQIEMHIAGEIPVYEAEFRMVCKDGSIIWTQDKGKITEYSEDGKPLRFVGVLQNISPLKKVEEKLHENQEALDIAVHAAELGTWDWDIPKNTIKYNKEYLDMLGYSPNDIVGSLEEWEEMNHPEDLPHSSKMLMDYV
ncbi:MAG: PAS domain-containing protein, partial [Anaerotignaceae bacterium]